jgi:hypothetical protein
MTTYIVPSIPRLPWKILSPPPVPNNIKFNTNTWFIFNLRKEGYFVEKATEFTYLKLLNSKIDTLYFFSGQDTSLLYKKKF